MTLQSSRQLDGPDLAHVMSGQRAHADDLWQGRPTGQEIRQAARTLGNWAFNLQTAIDGSQIDETLKQCARSILSQLRRHITAVEQLGESQQPEAERILWHGLRLIGEVVNLLAAEDPSKAR